jgi:hypothetical protein
MKEFTPAKRHVEVSVGESVRILREFQELSQNELADISGISQSTISRQSGRGTSQDVGEGVEVSSCCAAVPWLGRRG